jgi:hypothetical protein
MITILGDFNVMITIFGDFNVMITIFGDFCQVSSKTVGVILENQC